MRARAVETALADGHQDPHLHVVVAESLARETNLPEEIPALEHLDLGLRHLLGLALQVLDPARRTPGVRTTAVQDVYPRILLDRQHQPLALGNVKSPRILDLELGHLSSPPADIGNIV